MLGTLLLDQNGKDHKFLSKDWEELIASNDELKDYVYGIICDKVILQYKDKLGIDDVEFTDEVLVINKRHLSIFEEIKKSGGKVDSGEPNDSVLLIDGLNTFIRVFTAIPTTNEDGFTLVE